MRHVLIAVWDKKMESFTPLHPVPAAGAAIRSFQDACNGDSDIGRHPEDMELVCFGVWHSDSGEFDLLDKAEVLSRGVDFLSNDPPK